MMQRRIVFGINIAKAIAFMMMTTISLGTWVAPNTVTSEFISQFVTFSHLIATLPAMPFALFIVTTLYVWTLLAIALERDTEFRFIELTAGVAGLVLLISIGIAGSIASKTMLILPILLVGILILSYMASISLNADDQLDRKAALLSRTYAKVSAMEAAQMVNLSKISHRTPFDGAKS